jgi:hypothetical protein
MQGLNGTYAGLVRGAREDHEKRRRMGWFDRALWLLAGANDDSMLRSPFEGPEHDSPRSKLYHAMDIACSRVLLGESFDDAVALAHELLRAEGEGTARRKLPIECLEDELILAVLRQDASAVKNRRAIRLQVGSTAGPGIYDETSLELLSATAEELRLPSIEILRMEAAFLVQGGGADGYVHRKFGAICRWASLAGVTPRELIEGSFFDLSAELGPVGQPDHRPAIRMTEGDWRYLRKERALEYVVFAKSAKGEVRCAGWVLGFAVGRLLGGVHEILGGDMPLKYVPGARSKQQLIEALADPRTTVRLRVVDRRRVLEETAFAFNQVRVATMQEWWHACSQGQVRCKFELARRNTIMD